MRGNLLPSKSNITSDSPRPISSRKRLIFYGIGITIIFFGVLVAAISIAPEAAVMGIAGIGIGIPLLVLVWYRPEFGLLAVVFMATSLVRADIVDLRLPVGGLELRDLILLGMLGLLIIRGFVRKNLVLPCWSVSAPLIVFLVLALLSTVYALFFQHVEANWVFSELRAIVFYCVFFVVVWSITTKRQLLTVLISLFIVADVIVGVLILQQFLGGNQVLLAAMEYSNWRLYEMQDLSGTGSFGMLRIMPPGVVLIYFMAIASVCLMAFTKRNHRLRTVLALQFVFLSLGLLLTYTRALWVAVVCSVGIILLVLFPSYKTGLVRYFMMGFALICLLVGLLGNLAIQNIGSSNILETFFERVLSILSPEETYQSNSLQWRVFENESSIRAITEHPVLGVGLGNSYRGLTTLQGESEGWRTVGMDITRMTRFVHCSYFYLGVKMGLPALFSFFWFCVALLVRSWQLFRNLSGNVGRAIALAVLAGLIGLMLWSILHQHFMSTESTAVVGLMAGLVACIQYIYGSKESLT